MRVAVREDVPAQAILGDAWDCRGPVVGWLGQAGFLFRCGDVRVAIDLYLSDTLAAKYRGGPLPHVRMMPAPVLPEELTTLDIVFCTHSHTDHMDPGTLAVVAQVNPRCRFVVPRSGAVIAQARGVPPERMIAVDAGECGTLACDVGWHALASAHETIETDAAGDHHYLGYVLKLGGATVYHSGDCVPYPGLAAELHRHAIDLAILPVNGRDARRTAAGILGNFTFDEAVGLCRQAAIPAMLACHFGMFDFNTVDPSCLDRQIAALAGSPQCLRPRIGAAYELLG